MYFFLNDINILNTELYKIIKSDNVLTKALIVNLKPMLDEISLASAKDIANKYMKFIIKGKKLENNKNN